MARRRNSLRFSPLSAAVSARADAHLARPAPRCRRTYQFERLEDRLAMTGNGPGFIGNLPDPPDPNVPDNNPIVIQATLDARDDYLRVGVDAIDAMLNVLANDTSPDGVASLRVTSVTATKLGGLVTISADGQSLIYTPPDAESKYDPNYRALRAGQDSFTYVVEDSAGRISRAVVNIDLFTPLHGPQDDYFTVVEDSTNNALNVRANDYEFAGGTIVAVSATQHGATLSITDDGKSLIYSPPVGFKGYDQFTYTIEDAAGHSATVSVSIKVRARLEANHDSFTFDVDSPTVELNVLGNDFPRAAIDPPQIVSVDLPENFVGTVTISAAGKKLLFTPQAGFVGNLDFTYTVRYGAAEHHVTSAGVAVKLIDPYLAVDNWYMVDPGSGPTLLDVLANDPGLAGYMTYGFFQRNLTITSVSAGSAGGTIEITDGGKRVRYTPAAGFTGDETFTYNVIDEKGHVDSARVTVHVAFDEADPFNLPRFRHPGELAQFLIDEAVQRYANQFSLQDRTFVPNSGGGSILDASYFMLERFVVNGAVMTADYSTTNVQHAGIDEADVVETDGDFIYALTDGRLVIVDVRDVANPLLVSITQFDSSFTEMYLQGDRITLISRGNYFGGAKVAVLDVSDRGEPQLLERTEIDGQIVDTRAIGDRVFVVTQQRLTYPAPIRRVISETPAEDGSGVWQVSAYETLDEYLERVNETLPDLLPQFKTFNGAGELVRSGPLSDVNQIHKPISEADAVLMSVVTFDVGDATAGPVTSTGLFTISADQIYVSPSAVYVLRPSSRWSDGSDGTRILKFQFQEDGTTSLEAAGRVTGSILNQFSLDEHEGRLRVVTTETTYDYLRRVTRRENHLFVLEQVGTELSIVGSLERLAPTEEVKSVRFVGDRAYVVTFRQVDPLFMLDLSTPTAPTVAGAIKIPGYSSYLHPVGDHFILGIGRDVDEITGQQGPVQISLFDVRELGEPVLVDRMTLAGVDWFTSEALFDHHAIAYFADQQVLSIPISWRHTVNEDTDGDGTPDTSRTEFGSSAFVFQLDLDGEGVGLDFTGRIDHDSTVRRSVRIGDALVTVSADCVKVHELTDPGVLIAEVYVGDLPRFDQFAILEDSGPTELDVLANDRPGNGGIPLGIVSVTQPISYNWLGNGVDPQSIGTVTIAADGRSLVFTPAANFFGTAVFSYTVFDEVRGEQTTNVTVQVEGVPDLPDAVNDEFEVAPGSMSVPLQVLANDLNVDYVRPIFGWIDDYSYYGRGTGFVQGVVQTDFRTTIAATDSVTLGLGISLLRDPIMVLGSGYKGLKITAVSLGDHGGTIEIDPTGQFLQYTPAIGFEGIETFIYTIETGHGLTDTATVTVRVGAVPEVPQPDVALATSFVGPAAERETAPTELASPGRPTQVVAPPGVALALGVASRSGAAVSARQEFIAPSWGRSQFSWYRSLDSINLSHLASFRTLRVQSNTDLAFAELDAADESVKFSESDLESLAGLLVGSAEI